jgi:general secretion pathway protein G
LCAALIRRPTRLAALHRAMPMNAPTVAVFNAPATAATAPAVVAAIPTHAVHADADADADAGDGRSAALCRRRAPRRAAGGFTLIEIMVVLVIIGVLAALIAPNVLDRAADARVTAARTDVNNLMQALKLYKLDNQRFPSAEQGLDALVRRPETGAVPPNWKPYLDKLPADPWGRPYQYLNPGLKGEIDVFSFGADGQPGGEGRDADVGSWQ